jgi:hypothetical protein
MLHVIMIQTLSLDRCNLKLYWSPTTFDILGGFVARFLSEDHRLRYLPFANVFGLGEFRMQKAT